MKYFVIEIVNPIESISYRSDLLLKVSQCDFEVVSVCDTKEQAEKECAKHQLNNVKNQSRLHYEILEGEGNSALLKKHNELTNFYEL